MSLVINSAAFGMQSHHRVASGSSRLKKKIIIYPSNKPGQRFVSSDDGNMFLKRFSAAWKQQNQPDRTLQLILKLVIQLESTNKYLI